MRLHPRHYVLIALIVGLGIFNYVRARRMHAPQTTTLVSVPVGPVAQSTSWNAFDKAAALRDAPESSFAPALQSLQQKLQSASPSDSTIADVKGCQTWLMFYRQGVLHPSKDTSWRDRGGKHVDDCVRTHHDVS